MSDSSPTPISPAKAKEQKQLKMLAVLGVVLVLVLVFMVLKPFSGGDDTSAPVPTATTAPVAGSTVGGTPLGGSAVAPTETTAPSPPPARPSRTPFDPPK